MCEERDAIIRKFVGDALVVTKMTLRSKGCTRWCQGLKSVSDNSRWGNAVEGFSQHRLGCTRLTYFSTTVLVSAATW